MPLTRRRLILSLGAAAAAAVPVASCAAPGRVPPPPLPPTTAEAFLLAVEAGDLGEVRRLLAADVALASARDPQGRSAFVLAHLAGRPAVADELRRHLDLDAIEAVLAEDWTRFRQLVDADPSLCHAAHPIGGTPLFAAALAGARDLSRIRAAGCRPDAAPVGGSGFTPARAAMQCRTVSGALAAATDLLGNGADANARQRGGDSMLHGAVHRRSERLLRLAIRKGADPAARDADGRTPQELADQLGWTDGARLLAGHASLPRDRRASRWLCDANRQPIVRPDLSAVPQALQNEVTGSSHVRLARVRELLAGDPRLTFSVSTDDELAIEACAHTGNRPIIRLHLDHGAPLSLPTAVSLGDHAAIRFLLERDPLLVHERGAHDFPVMWYAALGGGDVETAALLQSLGVAPDQESVGVTALHWCARLDRRDLAAWLIEAGADVEALGLKWDRDGQTPLQIARAEGHREVVGLLEQAGARR